MNFYEGKRVFITGHTGFKGSYLAKMLSMLGANVTGYALAPEEESVFNILKIENEITSHIGDVRDFDSLYEAYKKAQPEIVFHLAAQPLVIESYKKPLYTYETNVMGTANLMECVRLLGAKSVVNVTTDKVYKNREWEWGYRENEALDGFDPYSNSKSCSELVTATYRRSFLDEKNISVSTMRAGNVIGGGDFAKDRIIPDCVRAMREKREIVLRNPNSTRPFQHVFEPLSAYMAVAEAQYDNFSLSGSYNVGPEESDCVTAGNLADLFVKFWGEDASWRCEENSVFHEASFLKLDNSKIKKVFGIRNVWNIEQAVEKCVEWTKAYFSGEDMTKVTEEEITSFWEEK
jgi:CDP-glucose 4,6-dehydratase